MIEPIFAIGRKEICQLMRCRDYRTATKRLRSLNVPVIEMGHRPAIAVKFLENYLAEASKLILSKPNIKIKKPSTLPKCR